MAKVINLLFNEQVKTIAIKLVNRACWISCLLGQGTENRKEAWPWASAERFWATLLFV